jgi:hypothetical protein
MSFDKKTLALVAVGFLGAAFQTFAIPTGITYTLTENGGNVDFTVTGNVSITDLTSNGWSSIGNSREKVNVSQSPSSPVLMSLTLGDNVSGNVTSYIHSFISPSSNPFTSSSLNIDGTFLSGDSVGFYARFLSSSMLCLPSSYTSGAALNSSGVFTGQSLSTLGLVAGTYTYSLTPSQTLTLVISSASPVPESAGGSVAGLGLVALGILQIRRRRCGELE